MLSQTLLSCLSTFESCFTAPSYRRFVTLMSGWLLCVEKRTVTGVMRASGVASEDPSGYHRFFSRGAWSPDDVGRRLLSLALKLVPGKGRVMLTLDDTLARHTGKHIASAGMHRDALLSTAAKPFFHFGHSWVVLAIAVTLPFGKTLSLPFLTRLYRTPKDACRRGLAHTKRTVLAAQMLVELVRYERTRRFLVLADNAYMNRSIVRALPETVDILGRGRLDAALYAPAPEYGGLGRPRVKGERVKSPAERAATETFASIDVCISGRPATVQVLTFDALWYIVGASRLMRFVVFRGWPGHAKDDVWVSTDLNLGAAEIIETYCQRWSIEETFGWVKSRLGFEDPHNRTEHAVHRTAPMALWAYSLVVLCYADWASRRQVLPFRSGSWYRTKTTPSFSDMLAVLRRQCWSIWVSDQASRGRLDQKSLAPLLDIVGYG